MKYINYELILQCLTELSDRHLQENLWMGLVPGQQSSPEEAVEGLFSDSGLDDLLQSGSSGLSPEVASRLHDLEQALACVRLKGNPSSVVRDPGMERVRAVAAVVLGMFKRELKKGAR